MRSACADDTGTVSTRFTKAISRCGSSLGDYRRLDFAIGAIAPLAPTSHHLEPPMSENDLKLAGTSFKTKDNYDFNVVNANETMLLIKNY